MTRNYRVQCGFGAVQLSFGGRPIVHAYCHCVDCRDLLSVPLHAVTAWRDTDVTVIDPNHRLTEYQHTEIEPVFRAWDAYRTERPTRARFRAKH